MEHGEIAILYLGAGSSRRMGLPKLSVELNARGGTGGKLGSCGLGAALGSRFRPIVAVTKPGPAPDWLKGVLADDAECGCIRVEAEDAGLGMGYSIRAGMTAAMRYKPKAVIVLLADQPLVSSRMIEKLAARWEKEPVLDYTAYCKDGVATPPILLAASMFFALLSLSGDQGARRLLKDPDCKGAFLQEERTGSLLDVDTEEDLALLLQELEQLEEREKEGQR